MGSPAASVNIKRAPHTASVRQGRHAVVHVAVQQNGDMPTHRSSVGPQHDAIGDDVLVLLCFWACASEGRRVVRWLQQREIHPCRLKPVAAMAHGK